MVRVPRPAWERARATLTPRSLPFGEGLFSSRSLFLLVLTRNQLAAQNLAHWGLRNFLYENVFPRALEIDEIGAADVGVQGRGVYLRFALHERHHFLPPALVRQSRHRHLVDGGVERDDAFDVHWRDVLPAAYDHV